MKTAPQLSESVVVSDRVEPTLILPIVAVLGYDPDHDAWKVGVRAGSCTHTLWVQRREVWESSGKVKQWQLYDIKQPLAVKASSA